MENIKKIGTEFYKNLEKLGFYENDDALFLINSNQKKPPEVELYLNNAKEFGVSAIYFRKQLNGSYQPQVYLYDFTEKDFNAKTETILTNIQKNIWSNGEIPIACFFFKTEIKIIDCTTHITDDYKPTYLIKSLKITEKSHRLYNNQFAIKIKSGVFWEEKEVKNKFKFSNNSSYNKLIENINSIVKILKEKYNKLPIRFINKLIVQSILIKYLEERIDTNGYKLLSDKYFKQFANSDTFIDVLKNGKLVELLNALNDPKTGLNGNVFQWTKDEQNLLGNIDLSPLAELLDTKKTTIASKQLELDFPNWRYFEFKYIPVELISRLYEEFLGDNKKEKGLYYTPAHLAKLLVDESLPLARYKEINIDTYKILDPACGSGIFLVTVFKRLVQIWRLQNNMEFPDISLLQGILRNIYGVDYEKQAIELASFSLSLALCNELQPIDIINKLKFDDLRKNGNLIYSDFFEIGSKLKDIKFDLIIGNPPFNRGAINNYTKFWEYKDIKVKIPQGQIALKFLSESILYLKKKGLLCLIIKSSGLLYNSTSSEYKKVLFSNYNVVQIFDFTALARNKSLWDASVKTTNDKKKTSVEPDASAIFLKNENPDINQNILHLTFRRTKATKERIIFEVDDYDLHFVDRITAIENNNIWKNNLVGGGRIVNTINKLSSITKLKDFIGFSLKNPNEKNHIFCNEGIGGGKSIPTKAFLNNKLNFAFLDNEKYLNSFNNKKWKKIFFTPNILINENINLPFTYNNRKFPFSNLTVGIYSQNNKLLEKIYQYLKENHSILRFHIISTSGKMLVYKNTAFKKEDILNLPYVESGKIQLSEFDYNIISDVNIYMQDFLRHGENSKAVHPIPIGKFETMLSNYGQEFSKALNLIYEDNSRRFRLSNVVKLKSSYIATIFKYDSKKDKPVFHSDNSEINIKELSDFEISKQLTVNRIIKLYPDKDTVVFIKPNQYRYWLSLIAYRDADKCFSDLSKLGY